MWVEVGMKPPPFQYHDPRSIDQALELLTTKENAKVLAGGQSLMPMLNMRFIFPDNVIDLNCIPELNEIREQNGYIWIGAMTRQYELERSKLIRTRCPILSEALLLVGHIQTRNRGTIGGSLCHLDPSAEIPIILHGLDAKIHAVSNRGARTIAMADFPAFYMTPAIESDEIVSAIEIQPWSENHGSAFVELARRHGDFALVGVAALLELSQDNLISRASITLGGVGSSPVRCVAAEKTLTGSGGDTSNINEAALACSEIEAMEDAHATATYRQKVAVALTRRAIQKAYNRAKEKQ